MNLWTAAYIKTLTFICMSRIQLVLRVNSTILHRVQFPAAVLWISEHLSSRKWSSLFSSTNGASDFNSVYGSVCVSVSICFPTVLYYPYCTMWHLKNKNIIQASAKHYSCFAKYGFGFRIHTHKLTHTHTAPYGLQLLGVIILACTLCRKLIMEFRRGSILYCCIGCRAVCSGRMGRYGPG